MKNIIIGVTGASGIPVAASVLEGFRQTGEWRTYLVMTPSAVRTAELEYGPGPDGLRALADECCDAGDIAHAIASGTFPAEGMAVVPCSMKTAAGIVTGYSDNLLLRAADVTLKERRKLVLVPREAPLSTIHCRNLLALSELGCIVIPPVMSFYNQPRSVQDMVDHIAGKVLSCFGVDDPRMRRWQGPETGVDRN